MGLRFLLLAGRFVRRDESRLYNFHFSIPHLFVESNCCTLAGVQLLAAAPGLQHLHVGTVAAQHLLHHALAHDVVDLAARKVVFRRQLTAILFR